MENTKMEIGTKTKWVFEEKKEYIYQTELISYISEDIGEFTIDCKTVNNIYCKKCGEFIYERKDNEAVDPKILGVHKCSFGKLFMKNHLPLI